MHHTAEAYLELQRGLTALASKYSTPEAKKILTDAIPLVFRIHGHIQKEDHNSSLDIIKSAASVFASILKHEPNQGGGVAVELSRKYLKETEDLVAKKAKIDQIIAWIRTQIDTLETGLNDGKPF